MPFIALYFLMLAAFAASAQNIQITGETTFHRAVTGSYAIGENVSVTDNGGILYVFVQNNSVLPDSVVDFKITQGSVTAVLDGWRVWPPVMSGAGAGNNISTITAKSIQAPVAETNQVTIEVWTKNGGYASQHYTVSTPKIRLANVLPSQDMNVLYVYLRNDDSLFSYTINELLINEQTYYAGTSALLAAVGGNYTVLPGNVLILKLQTTVPLNSCAPLAIRVKATHPNNSIVYVGAGIRVVESDFFIGTWHSSGLDPSKIDIRIKNRRLRYTNIHGAGNYNYMDTAYRQFFIRNIREANFGNPFNANNAIAEVKQQSNQPFVRFWSLDDEPDLSSKPILEQMEKNRVYWENDSNTPTYVNLSTQKKYSRYGWLPDVVSMDHYTAPDAPNIIQLTWTPFIGRKAEMKEALEYSEYLKFNTEPRRMYSWCQFQASTWGNDPKEQPRDYAVNYQFWAHIAGGAKGIDFFVLQDNDETAIPEQYNEGLKLTKQVASIRNLILYGEYSNRVDVSSSPSGKVTARALVGENAVVLIALNDNFNFTPSGLLWETAIDSVNYFLEFDVPAWLPLYFDGSIVPYRLLPDGSKAYDFQTELLANNRIRITPNNAIFKESHVFVIGIPDTIAPQAPTGLNVPKMTDDFNYTLSWNEPHDNFGTLGYIVKFNGVAVDTVYAPIFNVQNDSSFNCATALWEIFPFDNSWNIGPPQALSVNVQQPTQPADATIIVEPQHTMVYEGTTAQFTTQATNAANYEWQYSADAVYWMPVNFSFASGANASVLNIYNTPLALNEKWFRVIAKALCGKSDTSAPAQLTVQPNSLANELALQAIVSPNPSQGLFELIIQRSNTDIELTVTDVWGRKIHEKQLAANRNTPRVQIDIQQEPQGLYLLQLKTSRNIYSFKLIKN